MVARRRTRRSPPQTAGPTFARLTRGARRDIPFVGVHTAVTTTPPKRTAVRATVGFLPRPGRSSPSSNRRDRDADTCRRVARVPPRAYPRGAESAGRAKSRSRQRVDTKRPGAPHARTLDETLQKSDWSRRPLLPEQIEYAALDAEVLLALQSRLPRGVLLAFRRTEACIWCFAALDGESHGDT